MSKELEYLTNESSTSLDDWSCVEASLDDWSCVEASLDDWSCIEA